MRFTSLSVKIACLTLSPAASLAQDFGIELSMSMAATTTTTEINEESFTSPAPTPYDTSMPDAVWATLSPTTSTTFSPTAYSEDVMVQSTSSTESAGVYCGDGEVGNGICKTDGYCCSAYGYCGEGDAYW